MNKFWFINSFYGRGGSSEVLTPPEAFSFIPFTIRRTGSVYSTDLNINDYDFSDTTDVTYYFDAINGVNGNDGLTPETPKQSIQNVISSLNSSPPANGATFILMTDYITITNVGVSTPQFDICWKTHNNTRRKISTQDTSATYTSVGNDTYSWTKSNTPVAMFVIDETDLDEDGVPKRMTPLASQQDVEESEVGGVYYTDNGTSTVYFKLWDFRSAVDDPHIKAYVNRPAIPTTTSKRVFIQNIDLDSHAPLSFVPDALNSPAIAVFDAVRFLHSTNNGLVVDGGPTDMAILHNCGTHQSGADGNNYGKRSSDTEGPQIIEVGCIANNNGYGTGVSENGSTSHEGSKVVRINGRYERNKNRNVHDVNSSTKSYNVGCVAKSAKNQESADDSVDWIVGINNVTSDTEMWLDGCSVEGSTSLRNLQVAPGCSLYYRNMDISGWSVKNDGTIDTF